MKAVISILAGIEEDLPYVILDSDKAGIEFAKSLLGSVYQGQPGKIAMVGGYSAVRSDAEIEDLLPSTFVAKVVDRHLRATADEDFSHSLKTNEAIVPQIEQFAAKHRISLHEGWKVDIARLAKQRLTKEGFADEEFLERWRELFEVMGGQGKSM